METRWVCACLMAVAGALLIAPLSTRVKRLAWVGLAVAGVVNGVALNARPDNLVGNNLIHYYLGAKYPIPYPDFYRVVQAARGAPQIGMRDLDHPRDRVRASKWERRAYYIDMLRGHGVAFDPHAPLDSLADRAERSGAIAVEAGAILRRGLAADRIEPFRHDVAVSVGAMRGRPFIDDYGFNGSPFYVLLRRLDPALHRPFGRHLGGMGLAGQFVLALAFVFLIGAALRLTRWERVASAAILFASWDFVGYLLPGLVFGGVWIAVAVAAWALGRGRPAVAGVAIAWAGLLKLFPFVLLLPALVRGARRLLRPGGESRAAVSGAARPQRRAAPASEPSGPASPGWALRLVLACVATTVILGVVSQLTGRAWLEFFHKILVEFEGVKLLNNVSFGQGLQALGISPRSVILPLVAAAALLCLAATFFTDREADRGETLARRALVLISATGLVLSSWINYYAIVPLIMLPWYARERRGLAALVAGAFALTFLLPEFDAASVRTVPALRFLKVLPYWLAPMAMVAFELRRIAWPAGARRWALVGAQALLVITLVETARMAGARHLERQGHWSLTHADPEGAVGHYRGVTRLVPGSAPAHSSLAQALVAAGRAGEARAHFARAVTLAPGDAVIRDDFARLLMMAGHWAEAGEQLDVARRLRPADAEVLHTLALARWHQGRADESRELLRRARELDPEDATMLAMQQSIAGR